MIAASAALAVGGTLAVASSASAMQIPLGASTDTGTTTLYGLQNNAWAGLEGADYVLNAVGDTAVPCTPTGTAPTCTGFPAADKLTAAQAQQIAADFTGSTINGTAPTAHTPAWSTMAQGADPTYSTDAPKVAQAGTSWASLTSLITLDTIDPTDFPGGLYTVDGAISLSSDAVVTGVGKPTAYTASFGVSGAASTGFVLPSAFSLTFPASFTVNTKLVADEITPAQVASPPSDHAIGTATVTSPEIAALVPGSKGVDNTAAVYVVANANPSDITHPSFEVYLGQGDYILGTLSGVSFPLTVTFGEPVVGGVSLPLPVSNVSMTFPASTSPLQATSCTDLGTLSGTMTDSISTLAAQFGDTADTGAQNMTATATSVTNECPAIAAAAIGGIKRGKPTVRIRLKGNGGTPFNSETLTLPNGLKAKGLKPKSLKVSGAKVKKVIGRGRKIVVIFRGKTKSATVFFKKGIVATPALRRKVTRHKTKKLTIGYMVHYAPAGATAANSSSATITVKKLS